MFPKYFTTFLLIATLISLLSPTFVFAKPVFSDVGYYDREYEYVPYLYEKGIINGYDDQTFRPDNPVNRAEALKIILLSGNYQLNEEKTQLIHNAPATNDIGLIESMAGTEDIGLVNNSKATPEPQFNFPDIKEGEWFFPYVKKAFEIKIVNGYPDGTFHPEKEINLAETLKMIIKTNNIETKTDLAENPYIDVPKDQWHAPYFQYFKDYNLLKAKKGNVDPSQIVTRSLLCELIYKFMNKEKYQNVLSSGFGKATFYGEGDGFDGKNTASGEVFDKNKYTAASRTLPFGTKVRVTSVETGKSVEVIINDRGPYDYRFIFDLSAKAFSDLAPISRGFIDITYEIIQ